MIKSFLMTAIMSSMLSVPAIVGAMENEKFKEIPHITKSVDNGQVGKASWYGGHHNGKKMANGKVFNENNMTCAHLTYPFGTKLRVTNIKNGKTVEVIVTDRGGFGKYGRVIDLSKGAFSKIANTSSGIITVKIEKI